MIAGRQTHTHTQTDRETDTLFTILRCRIGGGVITLSVLSTLAAGLVNSLDNVQVCSPKLPLPLVNPSAPEYMVLLADPNQQPKLLGRFIRFAELSMLSNRHADRHTNHATSVTIGRVAMQSGLPSGQRNLT